MIDCMPPVSLKSYFPLRRLGCSKAFDKVSLTLKGRDAIMCALKYWQVEKSDAVLLPGYMCDAVSAAFNNRCRAIYYDIESDLSIDPHRIASVLETDKVRVLYLIHYFGFPHKNLDVVARLCRKHGVLLWEDHAHSALSRIGFDYADAAIFSFRKILPVADGGGVWLRGLGSEELVPPPSIASDVTSLLICARRCLWGRSILVRRVSDLWARRTVGQMSAGLGEMAARPISRVSARVVRSAELEPIVAERRSQFLCWLDRVASTDFQPFFRDLPDDVCPQGFPIWIGNSQEVLAKLEAKGVFLKIHWPLPSYAEKLCPKSWEISRSIITLPIYPGLSMSDRQRTLDLVQQHGQPVSPLRTR